MNDPSSAPASSPLARISGIAGFLERMTGRSTERPARPLADRVTLDLLGLGIGQAYAHLGQVRPGFEAFSDWVVATAGAPDPVQVARFNAWMDGGPVPEAAAGRLRAIDAMDAVLDADDLAHWDRHGYVVLRGALTREEAGAAEALLWRLVGGTAADPASWYRPRSGTFWVGRFQDPALEAARRSPRIHKAIAQLRGTADLWCSTDQMSFNPPETATLPFQGTPLHWDMSLAQPMPLMTGGILYLTDTAADGGPLRVVPGFHRRIAGWLAEIGDADPRGIDLTAEAVPVPAGAGDLVIWRHELPHGASPNRSGRPRLAQYVNYHDADVVPHETWL
ncbi:phytanoyl-CoA dioxygenase family protein [Lichenibacterium dinghuense]|uniref:phytanoyl-CoA dioxygenase family protein n=1 Tax=Lichenibacterium dinghuense TaxID=2895977 RepID=UPI001F28B6A0|nr:phytanoyl-CoA dioxygenase family protein [Lichenibacterium sp. 6Y81]